MNMDRKKLSPKVLKQAKKNIGEDETKKVQMLKQFREWIEKNPLIKKCRKDDVFLLRFLRSHKFSYLNSTQMVEIYLREFKIFPEYFGNLDIQDPKLSELLDTGFLITLPDRDVDGSLIYLFRPGRIDTEKFTNSDIVRYFSMLFELELDDEESQICGIKFVVDFANTPMKFFGLFSIADFKNIAYHSGTILAFRQNATYMFNIPFGAASILQFLVNMFTDNMKKVTHFLSNAGDLKKFIDVSILPEENGGKKSTEEIVKNIRARFEQERERILTSGTFDIVIDKNRSSSTDKENNEMESGMVGSFRKLEVD